MSSRDALARMTKELETSPAAQPRIWLVLGDKLGDNAQAEAIAEALGLPCERKALRFKPRYRHAKPIFRASLHHLEETASDRLEPPWPDLILTVGRRPSMAALWARRQSGGRSRLVLIGRPKRHAEEFDLIISTPQYLIPDRDNVVRLGLPLMRADPAAIRSEAARWQGRIGALPRPLTAVLVGGPTKPFRLNAEVARDLVAKVAETLGREGTLFFSTSRRTPPEVVDTLEAALPANAELFRWQTERRDNPYLALLGLADRCVVTADSTSMMVEALRAGRPLVIYPLPTGDGGLHRAITHALGPSKAAAPATRITEGIYRLGLVGYGRDLTALHGDLIRRGLATPIGELPPAPPAEIPDDLGVVVERIRALLPAGPG
ncbi:MAG: ELM1/GtrOC1 family putative glycosyltransferase [Kiloniellales bacterium]|nr:ELM1/GtrOC1 family putative glycosyltransferase [Kiloniellales bacterium]